MDGRLRIGLATLTVALVAPACAGITAPAEPTTASVEDALAQRFLDPLRAAGIEVTIDRTCHLERRSLEEPWHLEAQLRIAAAADTVANVLEAQDVVVVRDRSPMVVQQERGAPSDGWNGGLERVADDASRLGLTFNNVTVEEPVADDWADQCR